MRLQPSFTLLVVFLCLVVCSGLGQSNLFGVFRKRRRQLQRIQEKREDAATRKGFAGPSGRPLKAKEAEEAAKKDRSFWSNFLIGKDG